MAWPEPLLRAGRALLEAVVAVTLAPRCVSCASALEAPLAGAACPGCWQQVRPVPRPACIVCDEPLPDWRIHSLEAARCARCRRHPLVMDAVRAGGRYEGTLRSIVHAFKYDGRRSLARPLGRLMTNAGGQLLQDAACVIPVPLHPWRRFRRGFNQASDLAAQLDLPVVDALRRTRATRTQAGLAMKERRQNVQDAFALSRLPEERWARFLNRQSVVLVDDVMTTGATLDACARVLRAAGAARVVALTAARAASRRAA